MPILSVVVPTHNRAAYAKSCVEAVLAFDDPELQLVVTDTSIDCVLQEWLDGPGSRFLADPRLVYRKINGPSDVTKNHVDAFALATGDYLGVIGDDDCITGALMDAIRWAAGEGIPAITHTLSATYAWPDFRSRMARGGHAGRLYVPREPGSVRWRDSEADLRYGLARAFQGTDGLPRTYHGFVRRSLLEQIRERTGSYLHGSSPDMSGAVGIACQIERYCEVDIPLSIPGISGGSNSGRSALNTHKGDLSSDPQTRRFTERGWPAGLPRFFSVETVWAHAGLETLRRLRPELLPSFNYGRLLAICSLRHPDFSEAIASATKEAEQLLGRSMATDIGREMRAERWKRGKYLMRRALNPTAANGRRYFDKLVNVAQASKRYESYVRSEHLVFDDVVRALAT